MNSGQLSVFGGLAKLIIDSLFTKQNKNRYVSLILKHIDFIF